MDLGTAVYLGTYRDAIALIHELGLSPDFVERQAIGAVPRNGSLHHLVYSTPIRTAVRTRVLSTREAAGAEARRAGAALAQEPWL
jgi:hypothetical protein